MQHALNARKHAKQAPHGNTSKQSTGSDRLKDNRNEEETDNNKKVA